jgi:hypothetical protein
MYPTQLRKHLEWKRDGAIIGMYLTNKKQLAQRKELELKKAQRKETETKIKKVVYDTSSLVGLGIVALFFLTIIIQILS